MAPDLEETDDSTPYGFMDGPADGGKRAPKLTVGHEYK
jgi:hypothetical protein